MKRFYYFVYYLFWGSADSGSDNPEARIRSISLAWRLSGIVVK